MPRYDFRCRDCGNDFELERPVSRRTEATCDRCGSPNVQQRFLQVQAFVKGGGSIGRSLAPAAGG